MGVYIKGMDMPTEGEYNLTLYVCADGSAYMDVASFPVDRDKFEAVPVPPHGDLIDRDIARVMSWSDSHDGESFEDGVFFALDWLEELPTVIPASEDGET